MFSLQLSLVSVADNSHFCLFHINPYAKHKILIFPYKMRLQDATRKVSEAAGAR